MPPEEDKQPDNGEEAEKANYKRRADQNEPVNNAVQPAPKKPRRVRRRQGVNGPSSQPEFLPQGTQPPVAGFSLTQPFAHDLAQTQGSSPLPPSLSPSTNSFWVGTGPSCLLLEKLEEVTQRIVKELARLIGNHDATISFTVEIDGALYASQHRLQILSGCPIRIPKAPKAAGVSKAPSSSNTIGNMVSTSSPSLSQGKIDTVKFLS